MLHTKHQSDQYRIQLDHRVMLKQRFYDHNVLEVFHGHFHLVYEFHLVSDVVRDQPRILHLKRNKFIDRIKIGKEFLIFYHVNSVLNHQDCLDRLKWYGILMMLGSISGYSSWKMFYDLHLWNLEWKRPFSQHDSLKSFSILSLSNQG